MNIVEIKAKSSEELREAHLSLSREFVNLTFQKKLGQQCSISRFKLIRKSIARILTILNERKGDKRNA